VKIGKEKHLELLRNRMHGVIRKVHRVYSLCQLYTTFKSIKIKKQ